MENRLPREAFRPEALLEQPRLLGQAPSRGQVTDTFNNVAGRLNTLGVHLEARARNGEFHSLVTLAEKLRNGQPLTVGETVLLRDYTTLIDHQFVRAGIRNLHAADQYTSLSHRRNLTPTETRFVQNYRAGNFDRLGIADRPLDRNVSVDRFVLPVTSDGVSYFIDEGIPVEGLIRLTDLEIRAVMASYHPSNHRLLERIRSERDILFTSSQSAFLTEGSDFHARAEWEAYHNHQNALRSDYQVPDFYNGEDLIRRRRYLNILPQERGRQRLGCLPAGCLPWLVAVPLIATLLWPRVNVNPCYGTGGHLAFEVFDKNKSGREVSEKGAIEREVATVRILADQRHYVKLDDPAMRAALNYLQEYDPDYLRAYTQVSQQDDLQTAQRLRQDNLPSPWIEGNVTEFERRQMLARCLAPEQRDEKAVEIVRRQNYPHWYDPARDLFTWIGDHAPTINVS